MTTFRAGYVLAFAILLAAGIVGVVVMPTAGNWVLDGEAPAWPWSAAQARA